GRFGGIDHTYADTAECRGQCPGPAIQHVATRVRGRYFARALWRLRFRSDYFLPVGVKDEKAAALPPSNMTALLSGLALVVALVPIVGLAKSLTPMLERGFEYLLVPQAVVGIVIAALVLMQEGLAAVRAARANRLQTSLNLALGSALASIGLTIPTVAAVAIALPLNPQPGP